MIVVDFLAAIVFLVILGTITVKILGTVSRSAHTVRKTLDPKGSANAERRRAYRTSLYPLPGDKTRRAERIAAYEREHPQE